MEILRQHQHPIDAVFVAIGGGGLISGVAAYIKAVRPEIKVIGVQTTDSDAMMRSVAAGERVRARRRRALLRRHGGQAASGEETFRLASARRTSSSRSIPTPSAPRSRTSSRTPAASSNRPARSAVAGDQSNTSRHKSSQDRRFVAITCGANMNFDRLRFVAERAEVGEEREALFAVTIPEQRGSFRRLCELIGHAQRDRVQLPHLRRRGGRMCSSASPSRTAPSSASSRSSFSEHGFANVDLTDDELSEGAPAPHGRRPARSSATRRAALSLRVPASVRAR